MIILYSILLEREWDGTTEIKLGHCGNQIRPLEVETGQHRRPHRNNRERTFRAHRRAVSDQFGLPCPVAHQAS
ncbi:MAG: hypothetical protein QOI93_5102 [Rhodospirillaceae bacterium]|nr:hypothetical protein [Rhodospirillaceae bacterium]